MGADLIVMEISDLSGRLSVPVLVEVTMDFGNIH